MSNEHMVQRVRVICNSCDKEFEWRWPRKKGICPKCGIVKISDVKLAPGEIIKLFR